MVVNQTKFLISSLGCVYLVVLLDWYTKKIVGWDLSSRNRATEWKEALDIAIQREFPGGVRRSGLKVISDNGSQPTSTF
jgi:transposase InsO family protein